MKALISVSDKTGVVEFAKGLAAFGWEILSTSGTMKLLREAGIPVTSVSDVTGFPEICDGRVKTLHPKIHGALLARRDIPDHMKQIADNGLQEEVLLHDRFIPDDDVKYYFSAADFVVQPYKTATQSGVTQIAYQFCVPMVVTKVGGLAEIVPDGRVGYVCEPTPEGVAGAIERMYEGDTLQRFRENCVEERRRFSWEEMCSRVTELYGLVAPK